MKKFIVASTFALFSIGAFADPTLGANSAQNQQSAATSQAVIQPGAVAINSTGADSVKTVGNAPSLGVSSSFSSNYCGGSGGISGGWLGGALGGTVPILDEQHCGNRQNYQMLQSAAAREDRIVEEKHPDGTKSTYNLKSELMDASYEALAEISPEMRGILSRRHLVHGQAAVAYDQSGTVGMQPANYRVEEAQPK